MKNRIILILFLACMAGFSIPSFSGNGPLDPAGKGAGILGFGFGPGIPHYGFFSMYNNDGYPLDSRKSSHVGFLPTAFIGGPISSMILLE